MLNKVSTCTELHRNKGYRMQGFNDISLYDAILASDVGTKQVNGMRLKDRNISKLLLPTFAVLINWTGNRHL